MLRSILCGAVLFAAIPATAQTLSFPENLPARTWKFEFYEHNLPEGQRVGSDYHRVDVTSWSAIITCTRVDRVDSCQFVDGELYVMHHIEGRESVIHTRIDIGGATVMLNWGKFGQLTSWDWKDLPESFGVGWGKSLLVRFKNPNYYYPPNSERIIGSNAESWLASMVAMTQEVHRPKKTTSKWSALVVPKFGTRTALDQDWGNPTRNHSVKYVLSDNLNGLTQLNVEGVVKESFTTRTISTEVLGAVWLDSAGDVVRMHRVAGTKSPGFYRYELTLLVEPYAQGHTAKALELKGNPFGM